MEESENHRAGCLSCTPAVGQKHSFQGGRISQALETALAQVGHQGNGQDDLVGGKPQHKGQQQHPIQAQEGAHGVQGSGQAGKQGPVPGPAIGQYPQDHPRRSRHGGGSAQDKEGPVQGRADQHLAHLRNTVAGQLQSKGGALAPEHCGAEQGRCTKGCPYRGGHSCRHDCCL